MSHTIIPAEPATYALVWNSDGPADRDLVVAWAIDENHEAAPVMLRWKFGSQINALLHGSGKVFDVESSLLFRNEVAWDANMTENSSRRLALRASPEARGDDWLI